MRLLFSMITDFIQKLFAIGLFSSGVLIFAAEIKLTALKKASEPQSSLYAFTQKMTNVKFGKSVFDK